MSRNILTWEMTLGFYPGILFGVRSYKESNFTEHVLYLPFIDLAVTVYYGE